MVFIVLFLPFFIVSELRRANASDQCYFFYRDPTSLYIEKYFRERASEFSHPLTQLSSERPAVGVLEVTLSELYGLASALLASCTSRRKKKWHPTCFKFEAQFGNVTYSSNPHSVATTGDVAAVYFGHKFAFQVQEGAVPELTIKVYGCRTRKLTRGVKVKAVLGTAVVNLSELLNSAGAGQLSQSLPLVRESEGGREQARIDLRLQYRPTSVAHPSERQEPLALPLKVFQGLPVTGPDGAFWVAHPSLPETKDSKGGVSAFEEEEETGEYPPAPKHRLHANRNSGPHDRYPQLASIGSGLESGVQVLSL